MKFAIGTMICAVALIGAVPRAAHAAPQGATMQSDASLDTAITSRFNSDDSLRDYNIKASVKSGVATLTGTVLTTAQRGHAAELARNAGAITVDNKIVVSSTATPKGTAGRLEDQAKTATEKTKDAADKAADKTKKVAEKAWRKTKDGWEVVADKTASMAKSAGNEITDAYLTTTIHTKFIGEDALKGSDISVDTDKHVVTLKGTVASEAGRDKAVDIVKHTDGVNRIIDMLKVGPKK